MNRKSKALLIGVGLALVAALFGFKIRQDLLAEAVGGKPILWLAELWPPAAVLSIGLVTCLDLLLSSGPAPAAEPEAPRPPAEPKARRKKASRR